MTILDDSSATGAATAGVVPGSSISFYFPAGEFAEAVRRYRSGQAQDYGTHDEVAKLLCRLEANGYRVTVHSLVTPKASVESIGSLEFRNLGAPTFTDKTALLVAFAQDTSDMAVVHFPHIALLRAAALSPARVFAVLAITYNRGFLRGFLERRRIVHALNAPGIELVANHCMPSTRKLRDMGVRSDRLCAWDIPHVRSPADNQPKHLPNSEPYTMAYVGSVIETKGVLDLVRAVAILRDDGYDVLLQVAGSGETERVNMLAAALGVRDRVVVLGQIPNDRVFELFRAATIAAIPSHHAFPEGFPLTMFEAIASRTPILCSDHPVFADLRGVIDGVATVPQKDPGSIAAIVAALLEDPVRYSAMSRNADALWEIATGATDWGTLVYRWVTEGRQCGWINEQTLAGRGL
jgi:glycosyltransferase involved in cell wall biosynthesis